MIESNSFKRILKTTSILGIVQVIQILSTLVRGKLISVFMGAVGLGVFNLFNSILLIITQISGLGLSYVIVKEVSKMSIATDEHRFSKLLAVIRFWSIFSCLCGAVLVPVWLFFMPNEKIVNNSVLTSVTLSLTVICTILANNYTAVLQGAQEMRKLALSNALPAVFAIVISIPVYYYFDVEGVILGFLVFASANVFISFYYYKKIACVTGMPLKSAFNRGKPMVALGLSMMFALILSSVSTFLINSFIAKYGSIEDLGFYAAATGLTSQYIGLLFSAMSLDYFPRLSKISHDKKKLQFAVNEQLDIVILLILPLVCILLSCAKFLILLLLTEEFYVIIDVVNWLAVSLFFKAISFPFGYVSFAKGDRKVFLLLEGVFNSIFYLIFTVLFYSKFGLIGVGYASLTFNLLYCIIIYLIANRRYGIGMTATNFKKVIVYSMILCALFGALKTNLFGNGYLIVYIFTTFVVAYNGRKLLINLK